MLFVRRWMRRPPSRTPDLPVAAHSCSVAGREHGAGGQALHTALLRNLRRATLSPRRYKARLRTHCMPKNADWAEAPVMQFAQQDPHTGESNARLAPIFNAVIAWDFRL